jgi:hypothetical protein
MAENDREAFERREAEAALARARGHVTELRRLYERGASFVEAHPYFEQLEADLNTVRPQTTGAVVDWQGNELNADGTRVTGHAYSGTSVEPGSMASQPRSADEIGYQGAPAVTDDESAADAETIDGAETEEQRAARMRAEDV